MDLATIRDHLEQACRHIAQGDRHIERQREIVAQMEGWHFDAAAARDLLKTFEVTQTLHRTDRDRLELMLAHEMKRLHG